MTTEKLNQIYESIKHYSKLQAVDTVFQMFIDNQIVVSELDELLKKFNYSLPEYFYNLDKTEQKMYHQHYYREIHLINEKETIVTYARYNKTYFYELIEAAKKNKSITETLMKYVGDLDILPVTIIAMQNIRIKNLTFIQTRPNILELIENKKFNGKKILTLYDLYFYLVGLNEKAKDGKEAAIVLVQLKDFFKNKSGLNLNFDLPFVIFVFAMEQLLSTIPRKIANTIKMKFLCYKPNYLPESEYNVSLENGRTLINKHIKTIIPGRMRKTVTYYNKHHDIISSFGPNGYLAIYYSLLEEVKHA